MRQDEGMDTRSKCDNPDCGCHSLDVGLSNHIPLPESARGPETATQVSNRQWKEELTDNGPVRTALRAEGAAVERARIRQMARDRAQEIADGPAGRPDPFDEHADVAVEALRDFAALLEKP